MTRIALLADGISEGRGLDVATANLARALTRAGTDVVLAGASSAAVETVLGSTPEFACTPLDPVPGRVLDRARSVRGQVRAIERLRADCYVPVSFPYDQLAGRLNAPVVLYDHGAVPARYAPIALRPAVRAVAGLAVLARRRATGVVTVSEWLRRRMSRSCDPARIRVAPNGADHARQLAELAPDRFRARLQLGLPTRRPVALAVARCGPEARYKSLHRLGDALALRGFFRAGGLLAVVGRASREDRLWLARHHVVTLGTLDSAGLAAAYAAADVHVSASAFEGFNLPLIEAQWLGVPVLAVDRCAHPEVVAGGDRLAGGVNALADRVARIATGETRAERGAPVQDLDAARRFARGFTWASAAERFRDAVTGLTTGAGRTAGPPAA